MNTNISNNLIKYRKRKGIKAEDVAMLAGISTDEYLEYELGQAQPSLDVLKSIAQIYNVEPADFMLDNGAFVQAYTQKKTISSVSNIYKPKASRNIAVVSMQLLTLILMALPFVTFELSGRKVSMSLFSMLEANFLPWIILIITVWDIVDSIILLCPVAFTKRGYGYISSIIRCVTGGVELLIFLIYVFTTPVLFTGWILLILAVVKLIIKAFSMVGVDTKKLKESK